MFEPKMKKKTATFLNIKKKKLCYSYLVYAKNEEKKIATFLIISRKKNYKH